MLKKIWRHLCSDWIRVFMALFLAYMMYALRSGENKKASKVFEQIPVNIEYRDANIVNLDNRQHYTSVSLEGAPNRLEKVKASQIVITVEIDRKHLTNGLIELSEKNIKCPSGLKVKDIHSPNIPINLETIESKKVPVRERFDSLKKLSANYSVAKTTIFPAEVVISGPQSKIKNIREVTTSPIPLDGTIQDSFKYIADISPIADVTTAPAKVNCEISISRNFSKRTLKKVPVRLLLPTGKLPDFNYRVNPAEVEIEFTGVSGIVHFLNAKDFDVFVNAQDISKPGEYILNIRCFPRSNNVQILSVTPLQLTLQVQ